ncbi:hypothetical protein ALP12_200054 [Pseudomonas savastanoi pv. phaseolicola]|uniref:Uncharacterized protein n=1 Tax=Pseudomonas syringae TaxID=317 RepID=A0A2K4WMW4_PSESX|nr:hypothetical protein [Pseudomonas savastanoi pv. phaseolicola]SOS37253.1 hypothetical protein CFBP3840_00175 [Pseudomonas syringae]MBN4178524.1 hypothetical protein [Pseudomonas savastanoi pv. phaseolicola]MBN4178597.1 hypothetical protein [Pseudomonas savastanoi pv. phaseolicola]MBN4179243.1 hypothetical protein [Pseudomonas savastanoi pv. phaseolicola]
MNTNPFKAASIKLTDKLDFYKSHDSDASTLLLNICFSSQSGAK